MFIQVIGTGAIKPAGGGWQHRLHIVIYSVQKKKLAVDEVTAYQGLLFIYISDMKPNTKVRVLVASLR